MSIARTRMTAWVGLIAGCLSAVLILTAATPWLSMIGVLLLACVPTGAAVMCWLDSGEAAAQAGLTLTLSLTVVALASALMVWLGAWQPRALLGLAAAGVVVCAVNLGVRTVR